jgi:ABC-type Fe3+-hydroxamate transport system substrate-binding protein
MKKMLLLCLVTFGVLITACGSKTSTGTVIKSASAGNNLTVSLATSDGVLKHGDADFTLSFADASGKTVEVGAVAVTFQMPAMGTMPAMNNTATFNTTGTPVVYQGKVKLESAGDWQAQISYEGAAGKGRTSFTVTAQ